MILIASCLFALHIFGQSDRKVSLYFNFQGNKTMYDRVIRNNGRGAGPGLEVLVNTQSKFKHLLEINCDFFSGDKVMVSTLDGHELVGKSVVPCIFIGTSYFPIHNLYFALSFGPSFINSDVYFAIKPCIGTYLGARNRFTAKISLTNIFQRDDAVNQPFGYLNIGAGVKFF